MEKQQFTELFRQNLLVNGLGSFDTPHICDQFYNLTQIMMKVNQVMNLTAIREEERIIPLHYMDCILAAQYIPANAKVLDVGCGGGFPTLPLAIVRPDLTITSIDSTEKKVRYVQDTANQLCLNVTTMAVRAEELAHDLQFRETFDIVTSRAVARLNILDELCLPFVRVGGCAVLLKGAAGEEETAEANSGISHLGGKMMGIFNEKLHTLTGESEERTFVVIKKQNPTPSIYPRSFGQIKKKPL